MKIELLYFPQLVIEVVISNPNSNEWDMDMC